MRQRTYDAEGFVRKFLGSRATRVPGAGSGPGGFSLRR